MSKIRGKETKPEILVRKFLFSEGFRYRINDERYPGKPDIVLPKYNTVVFIHGCFWHGHEGCKASKLPKTNSEFWEKKISDNVTRDRKNIKILISDGWNVIIVWQCEIKSKSKREERLKLLVKQIKNSKKENVT
ncbi:Very-short-patch mismatch repair endonuclease (G-T specific) [Methanosarcina barkeri 227]|uniref:Very-short-patch mismatch repair endonuclease (G-T specific) n=2 Tax=Methanosarcina barkeri TaxID=2208 RepID=A0A0E3R2V8_METBA|nr:Very-short-patch mismatch repair endonuclease (G-T specific) [Methanosarcina barkeri 227]